MIQRRSKTDKLDAQLLANLLRINQIPLAYIPPEPYQQLRDLTRCRAQAGPRLRGGENQAAGHAGPAESAVALQDALRPARLGLVPRAGLRAGRAIWSATSCSRGCEHYDRQIAIFDEQLEECRPDFPQTEALTRHLRHRPLLGVVDRGGTRRGRAIPHGEAGRRLRRADVAGSSVGRPLLPRLDHAARLAVAALDSGRGGDEDDPRGRGVEELLHAGAKAFQREDRAGGGGPKTGGDLLETAAALAARTRRQGRVDRRRCVAHHNGRCWPAKGSRETKVCTVLLIGHRGR